MTTSMPDADVLTEARRLHDRAEAAGITVRLLGGAAVPLSTAAPLPAALQRAYKDLDYVVRRADAARWRDLLEASGYAGDIQFNTLHGAQRLLHVDEPHQRQLDTFVSSFSMCHQLDLEGQFPPASPTLAPADLLLTKLQIFEVNDKDLIDAIALLLSHPVSSDGQPGIDAGLLARITGSDWGWHTTISDNLAKVSQRLPTAGLSDAQAEIVARRLARVSDILATAPRSLRWRARARIGRRVPWYELPEEVD